MESKSRTPAALVPLAPRVQPVGADMPVRPSVVGFGAALLACSALPSLASAQATTRSQTDPRPVTRAALLQGEFPTDGSVAENAWPGASPIREVSQSSPDEA